MPRLGCDGAAPRPCQKTPAYCPAPRIQAQRSVLTKAQRADHRRPGPSWAAGFVTAAPPGSPIVHLLTGRPRGGASVRKRAAGHRTRHPRAADGPISFYARTLRALPAVCVNRHAAAHARRPPAVAGCIRRFARATAAPARAAVKAALGTRKTCARSFGWAGRSVTINSAFRNNVGRKKVQATKE